MEIEHTRYVVIHCVFSIHNSPSQIEDLSPPRASSSSTKRSLLEEADKRSDERVKKQVKIDARSEDFMAAEKATAITKTWGIMRAALMCDAYYIIQLLS